MGLRIPLGPAQIEAADRIYRDHMPQWRGTDEALAALATAMPDFGVRSTYLKVVTVNAA